MSGINGYFAHRIRCHHRHRRRCRLGCMCVFWSSKSMQVTLNVIFSDSSWVNVVVVVGYKFIISHIGAIHQLQRATNELVLWPHISQICNSAAVTFCILISQILETLLRGICWHYPKYYGNHNDICGSDISELHPFHFCPNQTNYNTINSTPYTMFQIRSAKIERRILLWIKLFSVKLFKIEYFFSTRLKNPNWK